MKRRDWFWLALACILCGYVCATAQPPKRTRPQPASAWAPLEKHPTPEERLVGIEEKLDQLKR
jgi:hypothetical protein